jgi:hypothetical protein
MRRVFVILGLAFVEGNPVEGKEKASGRWLHDTIKESGSSEDIYRTLPPPSSTLFENNHFFGC